MPAWISNNNFPETETASTCVHAKSYYNTFQKLAQASHFDVYKVNRLGPLSPKPWNPSDFICGKCTAVVRYVALLVKILY